VHQSVILGVADFRGVENVIKPFVVTQLVTKILDFVLD